MQSRPKRCSGCWPRFTALEDCVLKMVDRALRTFLHALWRRSLARVAMLHVAPPNAMPLDTRRGSVKDYVVSAIRAAAPKSTITMALATFFAAFCNIAM